MEVVRSTNAVLMESSVACDQVDRRAIARVSLVLDVAGAVRQLEGRVAVEGVLEREAGLDAGGERERLHRGATHAAGHRPVDLGLEVVLTAVDAADRAGVDLHAGHADVQLLVELRAAGADGVHAGLRGVHRLLGEGRLHPQPATVDLVVGEQRVAVLVLELEQLGLDHREHVALLAAVGALRLGLVELREPPRGLGRLVLGDLAVCGHALEDVAVALPQRRLGVLPVVRVEPARVVDDAGQRRALLEAQLGGGLVEERLGSRLDAVGTAAEVDGVEVALEDLLLALLSAAA